METTEYYQILSDVPIPLSSHLLTEKMSDFENRTLRLAPRSFAASLRSLHDVLVQFLIHAQYPCPSSGSSSSSSSSASA